MSRRHIMSRSNASHYTSCESHINKETNQKQYIKLICTTRFLEIAQWNLLYYKTIEFELSARSENLQIFFSKTTWYFWRYSQMVVYVWLNMCESCVRRLCMSRLYVWVVYIWDVYENVCDMTRVSRVWVVYVWVVYMCESFMCVSRLYVWVVYVWVVYENVRDMTYYMCKSFTCVSRSYVWVVYMCESFMKTCVTWHVTCISRLYVWVVYTCESFICVSRLWKRAWHDILPV